jgi:hypothetical protein
MILSRLMICAALVAASAAFPEPAAAQGFFERLFGLRPLPPPPASVPQQTRPLPPPPPGVPGVPPTDWAPENDGTPGPVQPSGPIPARPVAVRPPTEDSIVGRDLKLNGSTGALRIDRAAQGALRAQLTLAGTKVSQPTESCSVKLGDGQAMPLTALGRPDGLARYELQAPACPIVFDVIEGAVLVTTQAEACIIQEADCRVEPRGMWGPDPTSLIPKAAELEQARGSFDKAVRENYKALGQRAAPQTVRPIVAEQAAFSSEREQVCRSYAREGVHGFCNARYTEARAVTLASRLGILVQPQAAEAQAPRRPRPPPVSEVMPPPGYDPSYVR